MYLSILLIVVALIVFYNEVDLKHMSVGEIVLLAITFMAIIVASVNYMKINNSLLEGFTTQGSSNGNSFKNKGKKHLNSNSNSPRYDDSLIKIMDAEIKRQALNHNEEIALESSKKGEYLDPNVDRKSFDENHASIKNSFDDVKKSYRDQNAVNKIDDLLSSGNQFDTTEKFQDQKNEENIRSFFAPQLIVGDRKKDSGSTGAEFGYDSSFNSSSMSQSSSWDSIYKQSGDSMVFDNTMSPVSNLWRDDHSFYDENQWDQGNNWTQDLSAYANGQWKPNLYSKPSDWATYPQGSPTTDGPSNSSNPTTTRSNPTTTRQSSSFEDSTDITEPQTTTGAIQPDSGQKLCGAYDDLNLATDKSGNILIGNYTKAKKYFPGYTYIPPIYWDVPQRHTPVCAQADLNVRKLTGLMDRGLPINALELNPDGSIADTEETVKHTNVGSMMPKFNYRETPFSQPYA